MLVTVPRRELSIKIPVPDEFKIEYFDIMYAKKSLYICVLMESTGTPRVFLENEDPSEVEGVVKVFFRKKDIQHYMNILVDQKKANGDHIKFWEANFEEIVKFLIKIDTNNKIKTRKGVRGVACCVIGDTVVDLDIFWTNEKKLMV
jgi:hypothetical protein